MKSALRAILLTTIFPLATFGDTLAVNNGNGATNITSTSAWISATIVSTGAANPYLFSYWGTNDGGTNASTWLGTNAYGESAQGSHSAQITGLSGSTIYYFRAYGSNSTSSVAWAAYSAQFRTLNTPTSAPPSSTRALAVSTNGLLMNPTNFFHTNSPQMADALAGRFSDTNAIWGNISGAINDQVDLTNALGLKADAASIPVVGITAGTFYDGAQGDAVSNAAVWRADTNGWVVSAHTVSGVTAGTYYDGANGDYVSNAVVWKTDTNGWVVSAHEAWLTAEVDPAYATGGVQRIDTNGWVVSAHEAWLTAESDPAYATGAVQLAGATMTGPMTNLFGYFGNGAGLTNLASDPSGWSGYAATQQVVWYEYEIADDTNCVVITGDTQPATAGIYYWTERSPATGYYNNDDYLWHESSTWTLVLPSYEPFTEWTGGLGEDPRGEYSPHANSTGTATVAYGTQTNLVTWRAGYDTNSGAWAVSRNGTDMQAWYPGSNVLTGPVVIGGVSRESWPSEYSDTAIYGALNTVSNWTIAGSNLAYALSGNLSYASNLAVAAGTLGSNALPMNGGGAITGDLSLVGSSANLTATNLYLPRFGTVYFGTTNYIRDQGSNLLFHFNTNEAIFNW